MFLIQVAFGAHSDNMLTLAYDLVINLSVASFFTLHATTAHIIANLFDIALTYSS